MNQAYDAAGQPRPACIDAAVRPGTTPIRAAHVTELRAAVVNTGNNCSAGVRVAVESVGGGEVLTGEITACSGTRRTVETLVDVVIAGTVTARRAVSLLTLSGRANGDIVDIQYIDSMSAGQTESFSMTGVISTSASTLRCRLEADYRVSAARAPRETTTSLSGTGPIR